MNSVSVGTERRRTNVWDSTNQSNSNADILCCRVFVLFEKKKGALNLIEITKLE